VLIDRHTLTIVTDYFDAPHLFGFVCSQKLYLSEKIIASIAKQILQALEHASELGIRHRTLDESCIYVTSYDPKKQLISIKVGGFETYFLDQLQLDINKQDEE